MNPLHVELKTLTHFFFKKHIVDLVTFLRNKYVTVEGVKITSRIWKKWNRIYSTNLECIFNVLSIREKVYFRPFWLCLYVYFGVLRVNIGGSWVFFIKLGHVQGHKNIGSKQNKILKVSESFRSISLWSGNLDSGVKLDTSNFVTHNLIKMIWHIWLFYSFDFPKYQNPSDQNVRKLFSRVWSDRISIYSKLNE